MNQGFVRVACGTPNIQLGDPRWNKAEILKQVQAMEETGVEVAVFPELSLTGYTLGDVVTDRLLLQSAEEQLEEIIADTADSTMLVALGLPIQINGAVYNAVAVFGSGKLYSLIPKINFRRGEVYNQDRSFAASYKEGMVSFAGQDEVYFGRQVIFRQDKRHGASIQVLFDEDFKDSAAISDQVDLILVPAAKETSVSSREKLWQHFEVLSSSGFALAYTTVGRGESSTDRLFMGDQAIVEGGDLIEENDRFDRSGWIYADADIQRVQSLRQEKSLTAASEWDVLDDTVVIPVETEDLNFIEADELERYYDPTPFTPKREEDLELILTMQAESLVQRLQHIGAKQVFIGVSGGLDSTLAMLVAIRAFDIAGFDKEGIRCITMPSYGTSDRTRSNAWLLGEKFGLPFQEIELTKALEVHFQDIGLEENDRSVAFENAQARERTQILMDLSNKEGGIVVGTGDMSEIALGWSTFNGDHMSMYSVNASIPKTLVRELVRYEAKKVDDEEIKSLLLDIVDTPVSPELLPGEDGEIGQKTEEIIGPYEIHDFYLYHYLHSRFSPSKLLFIAEKAFEGTYDRKQLVTSLRVFFSRFFTNQFKRSTSVDGISVWDVSLSPRGGWRMPSDAKKKLWIDEIDALDEA